MQVIEVPTPDDARAVGIEHNQVGVLPHLD